MSFDLKVTQGKLNIINGDVSLVRGKEKLNQDILKIATTDVGSNPIIPWYGSFLSKSVVGTALDDKITATIAKSQLSKCFDTFKELQEIQFRSGQRVSADELLAEISSIQVNRDYILPQLFSIKITGITKAYSSFESDFELLT